MNLITPTTRGVFIIAVTPFADDQSLDEASVERMVDFYTEAGVDGLTLLGMMGEAPKLTHAEAVSVTRLAIGRAQGKPIIAGVSAPGLAAMAELTRAVMDLGAAGVMVAPPSGLRTDDQIVQYFHNVVAALGADVPLVLQDFPLSTGVAISVPVLKRLISELPSLVMLKHEDWPGLHKVTALREAEAAGQRRVSILCGNGGMFLTEELERGADGAMTGFGYPEMMVDICRLFAAGETEVARDLFDIYLPLMRYEQQPGLGLAVRKHILWKRGAITSPTQRRPAAPLDGRALAEIERLIARQTRALEAWHGCRPPVSPFPTSPAIAIETS